MNTIGMNIFLSDLTDRNWCVRDFIKSDFRSLAVQANNRNVSRFLRDSFPHPYAEADAKDWLKFVLAQTPTQNFAIAFHGDAVGGIGFRFGEDIHRTTAEIGYWLGEAYWGQGVVSSAVRAITAFAFATFSLERIYAGVFEENRASGRVLEKAGYKFEAHFPRNVIKDGRISSELIYAIYRD